MPLSEQPMCDVKAELVACDRLAWGLGVRLGAADIPVVMYGARAGRSLLEARRQTTFFDSVHAAVQPGLRMKPSHAQQALGCSVGRAAI